MEECQEETPQTWEDHLEEVDQEEADQEEVYQEEVDQEEIQIHQTPLALRTASLGRNLKYSQEIT